jgi:hypothetical protein
MVYLYLRHTIVDYARWKEAFDGHLAARQAGGATRETLVLRGIDHQHELVLLLGWHDVARARLFVESVSLGMALRVMGVVGTPEVLFLERVIARCLP